MELKLIRLFQVLVRNWQATPEVAIWKLLPNRYTWWLLVITHVFLWMLIYVGNICADVNELLGLKQVGHSFQIYKLFIGCFVGLLLLERLTRAESVQIARIATFEQSHAASELLSSGSAFLDFTNDEVNVFMSLALLL